MGSNDPNAEPWVCPHDGTSSEDMSQVDGTFWWCPTCERTLTDDDLVDPKEWARERREDQRLHDAGL